MFSVHLSQHGMSYLMQLVCGRCQLLGGEAVDEHTAYHVSRSILDLQTVSVFDLHKLQEDVVEEYIIGKPIIEQLPRMTFKFRDSLTSDSLSNRLALKMSCLEFKVTTKSAHSIRMQVYRLCSGPSTNTSQTPY